MEDSDTMFPSSRKGMHGTATFVRRGCVSSHANVQLYVDVSLKDIVEARIEGLWGRIIDGFRGGILADW